MRHSLPSLVSYQSFTSPNIIQFFFTMLFTNATRRLTANSIRSSLNRQGYKSLFSSTAASTSSNGSSRLASSSSSISSLLFATTAGGIATLGWYYSSSSESTLTTTTQCDAAPSLEESQKQLEEAVRRAQEKFEKYWPRNIMVRFML